MAQERMYYYVEIKHFYTDKFGVHHQFADAGFMPHIYSRLTTAVKHMERSIESFINDLGYRVLEYKNTPRDVRKCLPYQCKMVHDQEKTEYNISIYPIWIFNG